MLWVAYFLKPFKRSAQYMTRVPHTLSPATICVRATIYISPHILLTWTVQCTPLNITVRINIKIWFNFVCNYAPCDIRNKYRLNILLKQFVSAAPLKLNRISWNFIVLNHILCTCAYSQVILIQLFWALTPFELRSLIKIKYTNETVCHRKSCSTDKDILCISAYSQEIRFNFCLREQIELWAKCTEQEWQRICSIRYL